MAFKTYLLIIFSTVHCIQINHPGIPQPINLHPQATGYIYRSDNDGPASIIQLGTGQQIYHQPQIFATPIPVASQKLLTKAIPSNEKILVKPEAPEAKSDSDDKYEEGDDDDYEEDYEDEYEDEESEELESEESPEIHSKSVVAPNENVHSNTDYDETSIESSPEESAAKLLTHESNHHNFQRGGGSGYLDEKSSSRGEKAREEYDSKKFFNKGEKGHHDNAEHQEYSSEDGGESSKHIDEDDKHGHHHAEESGAKGEDFKHKKAFKKGEKVTGYHNIYKKDEYKKNREFYDEADESGHFKKHSDDHSKFAKAEGAKRKASHHKSGHEEGSSGKKGRYEKGQLDKKEAGHALKHGEESYQNENHKHAKKGGSSDGRQYQYKE